MRLPTKDDIIPGFLTFLIVAVFLGICVLYGRSVGGGGPMDRVCTVTSVDKRVDHSRAGWFKYVVSTEECGRLQIGTGFSHKLLNPKAPHEEGALALEIGKTYKFTTVMNRDLGLVLDENPIIQTISDAEQPAPTISSTSRK